MFCQHSGAEKIEELTATLEEVTKEQDDLCQEVLELYVAHARLAEAEQTIKKLKLDLAEQSEFVDFYSRTVDEYK